jgi:hypothetical protein
LDDRHCSFTAFPPRAGPGFLPELLSINVTDLLAARASDYLPAALEGEPEALRGFEQEAERLLETEDIRLRDPGGPISSGAF